MEKMKLYHYDHCPYCIRVRMILGLKNIDFQSIILGNSDEKAHFDLVGKKIVPILEYEENKYMLESLDIVKYIDEYDNTSILNSFTKNEIQNWIDKISLVSYSLIMPRFVQLHLEEFSTQKDIDYFRNKKERFIGNFDENMNNTPKLIKQMEMYLKELDKIVVLNDSYSYDDICLFPILRNLTCVKGLTFPKNVETYIDNMSKISKVDLYGDKRL